MPIISADQAKSEYDVVIVGSGAAGGQTVILNLDGKGARDLMRDEKTPVRYFVIGLVDE